MLRRSCVAIVALASFLAATNCRSPGKVDKAAAPDSPPALPFDPDDWIDRVETWRDRAFETPPTLEVVDSLPDTDAPSPPAPVRAERRRLADVLFGLRGDWNDADGSALERIARYDPDAHTVFVRTSEASDPAIRAATAAALVDALDRRHLDALPRAKSWDEALALRAADDGMGSFVAALAAADGELTSDRLAARPEVVADIAPLDEWLDVRGRDEPSPVTSPAELDRRLDAFALREGLSLTAALLRAGGWSGAELPYSIPPRSTMDVVRPDRWMNGEGLGTWEWPDDAGRSDTYDLAGEGRVGPVLAAVLIGQKFPARLARTAYSGWSSDHYRLWRPADDAKDDGTQAKADWRFEWLSLWGTPAGARQIRKALDTVFAARGSIDAAVLRRGLKVVVIAGPNLDAQAASGRAVTLADAKVLFKPQRRLPLSFEPTALEAFRTRAARADIADGSWSDPATGLTVDLTPLEDWRIAASQTLPLRWFARHPDGAVFQLSTELVDPLGPAFGSKSYVKKLRSAFKSSFEDPKVGEVRRRETPADPTIHFAVTGSTGGRKAKLHIWHFRRGEVRVTLSLQAAASNFEQYLKTARRVVDGVKLDAAGSADAPAGKDDSEEDPKDKGIDYEIEPRP